MKVYQINASGNALILMKVDGDKIEILNGVDGWGIILKKILRLKN